MGVTCCCRRKPRCTDHRTPPMECTAADSPLHAVRRMRFRQPATPAAPSRAGFSIPHILLKWASARPTWTYSTAGMARAMRSEGGHRSCRRFRSSSPERCQ